MSATKVALSELVRSPPSDLVAWAVMHLISRESDLDFMKKFGIEPAPDLATNTITVEMRINGIEVPVREVFAELQQQHDDMVKREAMALVQQRCALFNEAGDLAGRISDMIKREASRALGVDWEDRW